VYWSFGIGIVASVVGVGTGLYRRHYLNAITGGLLLRYFLTTFAALRSSRPAFLRLSTVLGVAILVWAVPRVFGAVPPA
jgi:hypothetical protein